MRSFKPKLRPSAVLKKLKDSGGLRRAVNMAGSGIGVPLAVYWGLGGFDRVNK